MKKDESIKAFFKALKISLKNYSIYNKDHPSYKKSIKKLRSELDKLFHFYNRSLKIGFTSNSIYFGNECLEEEKLYRDVAKMFHFRKLKRLEIKSTVTTEELELFLSKVYLPRKDIFKKGGIKKILEKEKISNINVTELDYSQLLKGEGEEIKDIWTYLLKEATDERNESKMEYLADNYDRIHDKIDAEEVISDDELQKSFESFFNYLNKNEKEKYISFSKRLMKSALSNKKISSEEKLDKLKPLLMDLSEDDLASTLWEEIITNQEFGQVNFSIFSKLIEKEKKSKVAESLLDVFNKSKSEKQNEEIKEKIRQLLSGTSSHLIPNIYRRTLQSLLKDISEKNEKIIFDNAHLQRNYYLILLNMLEKETEKEESSRLIKQILDEWKNILESHDMEYLKYIHETLEEKRETLSSLKNFHDLESILVEHVEKSILNGELSLHFNYFIENMNKSNNNENVYLKKIFTEETITPYILKAFFRFFTDYLFYFNLNLDQRSSDKVLLRKIIDSLSLIDSPVSLITLKYIFKLGDTDIKLKTLKAMENLKEHDDKFLFPLLKKKNYELKKEAFVLLSRDESSKHQALDIMFSIKSFLGLRNKRLQNHVQIIDELEVESARSHLISLAQRKFIWNKKLRNHAENVLRKWDAGKS
jgi:hypothetical protein